MTQHNNFLFYLKKQHRRPMIELLRREELSEFDMEHNLSDVIGGMTEFMAKMMSDGYLTTTTTRIGKDLVLEFHLNRNAVLNAPSVTGQEVFPVDSIIHDSESQDVKVASITLQPHHRRQLRDVMELMDKDSAEWVLRNLIENAHLLYKT